MVRLQLGDNVVVDTDQAGHHWGENSDGKTAIGQWDHVDLYRSRKGRFYIVHISQWQGVEEISPREAAIWLLKNGHDLPEDLAHHEEAVIE
ncbi:MAG: hypothetical protein A4E45_00772 [Methanosaeta sp. PtaB.Bin039]|nr:MAG: hypothetical protein A4E45_00772 [Methanosaeta sp. PtaB.Bin039]